MAYNEEISQADRKYQSDPTVRNELELEKAKLKYWMEELQKAPGDKDIERKVVFHKNEVDRLESEVKMA